MKKIAIIGTSKTGKTSTTEFLMNKLVAKGFKIGSAKHVHHQDFTIDLEGKDTWRHANAGSKRIVCLAEEEVTIIRKEKGPSYSLEQLIKLFQDDDFDALILEGFHWLVSGRKDVSKIITAKDAQDAEKRLNGTVPPILAITGKISNIQRGESINAIPILDLKDEGEKLLDLVLKKVFSSNKD